MQVLQYLSPVDGVVVLGYLAITVALGLAFRRQKSSTEFLLANRGMGWLPVGLSVMATLFSANSFIMMPGESFRYNLLMGMGIVGIVCSAPIVMYWIIPIYARSGCFTAYELLEKRFDVRVRLLASMLFILLRTGWMAAATYSCSLAVSVISGTDLMLTIWVMGMVTTLYTVTGGIKAVMWNDVAQFVIFSSAIVGACILAIRGVPGGWSGTWESYAAAGKLEFADFRLDLSLRMGSWALLIGMFVENLSAYSTDQALVQRYLTAKSVSVCRWAFLANITGVMIVAPGLMILGTALSSFYAAHPHKLALAPIEYFERRPADLLKVPDLASTAPEQLRQGLIARYAENPRLAEQDLFQVNRQDEAMPLFVRREMPRGIIGLVIAALLAATMSSIAGGIHSIATSINVDFKNRFLNRPAAVNTPQEMRFIRLLTLILGVLVTALSCVVERIGPVFDICKKLNGAFSGPLLAMFVLAFFFPVARTVPVLISAVVGTAITGGLTSLSQMKALPMWMTATGTISPMWFCVIGFLVTWLIGYTASRWIKVPPYKKVFRGVGVN